MKVFDFSLLTTKIKAKIYGNGIRAYYWTGEKNFGDLITPFLLGKYGYTPIPSPPSISEVILCGSNLDIVPPRFKGVIAGAGYIEDGPLHNLPHAKLMLVRGELTRARVQGRNVPLLGDPGLAIPNFIDGSEKKNKIGIIPHHSEVNLDIRHSIAKSSRFNWISPKQDVRDAVQSITECECILSSSLHGLIIAEAYSIPNAWIQFSKSPKKDTFKYKDYYTSLNTKGKCFKIEDLSDIEDSTNMATLARKKHVQDLAENVLNTLEKIKHEL